MKLCIACGAEIHWITHVNGQPYAIGPTRKRCVTCVPFRIRGPNSLTAEDRFWAKVVKTDGCWGWTGATRRGYGACINNSGRMDGAHRFSWRLHFGTIPDDINVLHKCDNPPCTRPDHLFLGTDMDNTIDKIQKQRQACRESHGNAVLDEFKVREIRRLSNEGTPCTEIARRLVVPRTTVSNVLNGWSWNT